MGDPPLLVLVIRARFTRISAGITINIFFSTPVCQAVYRPNARPGCAGLKPFDLIIPGNV